MRTELESERQRNQKLRQKIKERNKQIKTLQRTNPINTNDDINKSSHIPSETSSLISDINSNEITNNPPIFGFCSSNKSKNTWCF